MTTLNRVLIEWSGAGVVGRAVTVLHYSHSDNAAPPVAAIKSAFTAAANMLPQGLQLTFPNSGDVIDDTTGNLAGTWTSTGGGVVAGAGIPACTAGVGACIGWSTGQVVVGLKGPRKLRGRTFIAPLDGAAWDADGTLKSNYVTNLQTLAAALMAAGPLAVWHRPTTKGGSDGNSYGVGSYKVRDKAAYLSSRRD